MFFTLKMKDAWFTEPSLLLRQIYWELEIITSK